MTFEEAIFGVEKEIEYRRHENCPSCRGSGAEPGTDPVRCPGRNGLGEVRQRAPFLNMVTVTTCDQCRGEGTVIAIPCRECRGEGRVRQPRRLSVKIPAGVDNSQQIRISGEGDAGPRGGPAVNLHVALDVQQHDYFVREGNEILLELPLNIAQAALGAEVDVPTVDGTERLKVQPGVQTGATFRLRGKGVPFLRGNGRGDQIVVARVVVPTKLNDHQRRLFQELADSLDHEPIGGQQDEGFFGRAKERTGALVLSLSVTIWVSRSDTNESSEAAHRQAVQNITQNQGTENWKHVVSCSRFSVLVLSSRFLILREVSLCHKTTVEAPTSSATEPQEPFYYGWRYVRRVYPNGREVIWNRCRSRSRMCSTRRRKTS